MRNNNYLFNYSYLHNLKERGKEKVISYAIEKGKTTFGTDMRLNSTNFMSLNKFYKERKIQILSEKNEKLFPDVSVYKIVKIDKYTCMLIIWDNDNVRNYNPYGNDRRDEDEDNRKGYVYWFGRNSYIEANKFKSSIREHSSDVTVVYNISGSPVEHQPWKGLRQENAKRTFDTIYLNGSIEKDIKDFLDSWLSNEEIYTSRGITFKTGILLHGNPGTGKSTIASAIASYLDCDIINIDCATFGDIDINDVSNCINLDNKRFVVLLDDVDVILSDRKDENVDKKDKEIISKLLALLDSPISPNNVVFVATTNYIDKFDEAIRRHGRFDKIIEIGNIDKSTAVKMCEGFGLNESESKEFINQMNSDTINPAELQAKLISRLKKNIQEK